MLPCFGIFACWVRRQQKDRSLAATKQKHYTKYSTIKRNSASSKSAKCISYLKEDSIRESIYVHEVFLLAALLVLLLFGFVMNVIFQITRTLLHLGLES